MKAETVAGATAINRYRLAERRLWQIHGLDPAEHSLEIDQPRTSLRLLELGSGPPVLFLPGSGGTGPYWAPLVRELSAGFRCMMLDRPGWGLSEPIEYGDGDYWSLVTSVLGGTLDQLGLQRLDVVGASLGGAWGLRLAQAEPNRVRRVVLLGGSPTQQIQVPTFIRLLRSPIGTLLVRLPMRRGMLKKQLIGLGHGPGVEAGRFDAFFDWRMAFQRETSSMRHERDMVRAIVDGNGFRPGVTFTEGELAGIAQPVLMLFGTADPTGSVETWRRLTDVLPGGRLQLVNGAGHLLWWDEPAVVSRHLAAFLDEGT